MMALNRYRLRHKVRSGNKAAIRTSQLLERPDRLIGVILIGNNFVNISASAIATVIAVRLWGDAGIAIATLLLTMIVLIFGEVMPKTLAAWHPERIAFFSSLLLKPLLKLFYPLVVVTNGLSNLLLKIFFRIDPKKATQDQLSQEELKTLVNDAGSKIPKKHRGMLLGILDLEKVTINDIMVPKNEIVAIDLDDDMGEIISRLKAAEHTRLPLYRGNINDIEGMLHMRDVARLIDMHSPSHELLMKEASEPYFVPESTPLHTQLVNFQTLKQRSAIVVDEYGDVIGLVTLEDILEEIVGEFTTDVVHDEHEFVQQTDGSWLVDGTSTLHDLNKNLGWSLPQTGPKTFNGLITEYLEEIPETPVCLIINDYRIEILVIENNRVKRAKVFPQSVKTTFSHSSE